jgi:hypothetical protein
MRTIDISAIARRLGAVRIYNLFFFLTVVTAFSHVVADAVAVKIDAGDIAMLAILLPIAWLLWTSADPVVVTKSRWASVVYAYSIALCLLAILVTALAASENSVLRVTYSLWFALLLVVAIRAFFSVRRFKADKIGDLGLTVSRLIGDDANNRRARIAPAKKTMAFALAMIAVAVVMLLLRAYTEDSLTARLQAIDFDQPISEWDRMLAQIEPLLLTAAIYFILKARISLQPSVETLLSTDRRPATLYLRSFSDDEKLRAWRTSQYSLSDFSLEGRLAGHLSSEGPFIAVGSPDHETPPAGAARAYLTDGEWQSRVGEWMESARLIILAAGTTQWVEWELKQIVERGHTGKLVALIPEKRVSKKTLPVRIANLCAAFKGTKWEAGLAALAGRKDIRALTFDWRGEVTAILGKRGARDECQLAALVGEHLVVSPASAPAPETSRAHEGLLARAVV